MSTNLGKPWSTRSQELENERPPRPPERLKIVDSSVDRAPRSKGYASRPTELGGMVFGPPTDATLDGHRDNDHLTRWEADEPTRGSEWLVYGAGIAFVLGSIATIVWLIQSSQAPL